MRRTLVTFLTLLLLWAVVAQVNHVLDGHVYLFLGGLFVAYAALQLPLRDGLTAVLLAGRFNCRMFVLENTAVKIKKKTRMTIMSIIGTIFRSSRPS